MTTPEERDKIVDKVRDMIAETGHVIVAQDVFDALVDDGKEHGVGWTWDRYGSVSVHISHFVEPGTIMACKPPDKL